MHGAGFQDVVIGLSGGLDSSLVCAIAVRALGSQHVHGVLLPGPFSSEGSISDAEELATRLDVSTITLPITDAYDALAATYARACGMPLAGLASENTQARLRMCAIMALSNANGWLMLNTGNLSEAAMGYSTLYGDTAGAFAPIGGLYKTEAIALARFMNDQAKAEGKVEPIPQSIISKPPSAELSEGQTDEASLGISYDELDRILSELLDEGKHQEELAGQEKEVWERYLRYSFKREMEPAFADVSAYVKGRI